MADEITVPLLPGGSLDSIIDFYGALGFQVTHRQQRPDPYVALRREDLHLHFFGMPDFDPEQSYGSCLVLVPALVELHAAFAAGLRATYGKVPVSGIPRMTRPRPRRNGDGVSGFSIVDPGGNWIRIMAQPTTERAEAPTSRLATSLQNAVVQGDSRGNHTQAAKILDSDLARPDAAEDPCTYVEALVYRAELALALGERALAHELLARVQGVVLTTEARQRLTATLQAAAELRTTG